MKAKDFMEVTKIVLGFFLYIAALYVLAALTW